MDKTTKALAFENQITVTVINGTQLVNDAISVHHLTPVAGAALGRTLLATAMMTGNLKNVNDTLTIQINGGGIIGNVVTSGDYNANVRGYVDNPQCDLPLNSSGKLDVGGVVGHNGNLVVLRKDENGKIYTSSAELISGEIAEDFAYYFATSEQSPSAILLGVLIDKNGNCISAGGMLINVLPNCSEDVLLTVENILPSLSNISSVFAEKSNEEILSEYFNTDSIISTRRPMFKCKCNAEMIEGVVLSLTTNDVDEVCVNDGQLEILCPFCNTSYKFSKQQAYNIINSKFSKE